MTKADDNRDRWIEDCLMFQRIAGVAESSVEELKADWDSFNTKRKSREADRAREHRIIQDMASGPRRN